jgi:glycosyltransferase involved in cell wall biosynthesis
LLTLVGPGYPSNIKTARRNVRIQSLGTVPEERLISLYKECTFTVFPSLDEGFGLPITESLWFGKPCICAGFGSMGEIANGGGCLTVDPRSTEQLSDAITRLITEPQLRQKLAREACARSLQTWSDYAGSVLNTLNQRQ